MKSIRGGGRVRKEWAVILLAGYCFIAGGNAKNGELFPFFYWSLFSIPKAFYSDFSLLVTELDGQKLAMPAYIERLHLDGAPAFSSRFIKAIGEWGDAEAIQDSARLDALRSNVEVLFKGRSHAKYFLMKRRYEPVSLLKTGQFEQEIIVGEYEYRARD